MYTLYQKKKSGINFRDNKGAYFRRRRRGVSKKIKTDEIWLREYAGKTRGNRKAGRGEK